MTSMPIYRSSRYLRQPKIQVTDSSGTAALVYEQRDTTVTEAARPYGTRKLIPEGGSDLWTIARRYLGRNHLWWIVADMNPEVFYPLDYVDATEVRVPPQSSLLRFQRKV